MIGKLLESHSTFIDVIIIVPNMNFSDKKGKRIVKRWLRTASLYFYYYKFIEIYLDSFLSRTRSKNISSLANRYKVKVIKLPSQNESLIKKAIDQDGCDFLISMGHAILSKSVISSPKRLCVNVHGGELPKYRGLSNYVWMLLEKENIATVTLHELVEKIDAGRVINQLQLEIDLSWSAFRLNFEMSKIGAELVSNFLDSNCQIKFQKQTGRSNSAYRGLPTPASINDLKKIGRKLIKISDLKLLFVN